MNVSSGRLGVLPIGEYPCGHGFFVYVTVSTGGSWRFCASAADGRASTQTASVAVNSPKPFLGIPLLTVWTAAKFYREQSGVKTR